MLIGEKIRKIRTIKGLSQDYIAEKLKISQVAYSDIENNKTKLSINRLESIGTIFEMKITDILTFDEKQVFNNTFNDTSKGFFNVQKVINDAFENERFSYKNEIQFLKEEIIYLRNKLDE
jgi:transcriptional regulator with XRE-family HTH domain